MDIKSGAATVYGVLYQILGSIERASNLYLQGHVEDENLLDAKLILEPSDGGDLKVGPIVEQWKSRRSGRKWTIREIIEKVIPDLYKSVKTSDFGKPCTYRFVTEGDCSDWGVAQNLFLWMSKQKNKNNPSCKLDRLRRKQFFSQKKEACSEYEFFDFIVSTIKKQIFKNADEIDINEIRQKLWHLLSNFEIIESLSLYQLKVNIDSILRNFVDYPVDDLPGKRDELCGIVLEMASQQGTSFTPEEFFKRGDLNLIALKNWKNVFRELHPKWQKDLIQKYHYNSQLDVRLPDSFPSNRIIIISGESGQGKTWRLAAYGNQEIESETIVAAVRATGLAKRTLQEVADFIWKEGFGRQREMSLDGITNSLRKDNESFPDDWLTILIDEVRSYEEARNLIEYPWEQYGIRLVMATGEDLAKKLVTQFANDITLERVENFTPSELREYLDRHDISWGDIPADMRLILLRPLLALLYSKIAKEESQRPANEYRLFESMWDRIAKQAQFDDGVRLSELMYSTLEEEIAYPWKLNKCHEFGIDSESLQRLIDVGWLERDGRRVRVWHTRLLNWLVAECLAEEFRRSGDEIIPLINEVFNPNKSDRKVLNGEYLEYVPMDLLWLLCDESHPRRKDAHLVLESIEQIQYPGMTFHNELFNSLIPTLGPRVMAVLSDYYRHNNLSPESLSVTTFAKTLNVIGLDSPLEVSEFAVQLLADPNIGIRVVAPKVLKELPTEKALNDLWSLLKVIRREEGLVPNEIRSSYTHHKRETESAISKCARLSPRWIETCIRGKNEDADLILFLTDILSTIDGEEAQEVWQNSKECLFRISSEGSPSLARCIDRFEDENRNSLLESWIKSNDTSLIRQSFETLSALNPKQAISILNNDDINVSALNREYWLPLLYEHNREATLEALNSFTNKSLDVCLTYYPHFRQRIHFLHPQTLKHSLQHIEIFLNENSQENRALLRSLLSIVSNVCDITSLDILKNLSHSPFEEMLITSVLEWLKDYNEFSHDINSAIQILLRIQGSGFSKVINAMLKSNERKVQRDGLEWATFQPTIETHQMLYKIAINLREDAGKIPHKRILQDSALEALALLGSDKYLIEALISQDCDFLELGRLRKAHPPVSNELLHPILAAIQSNNAEQKGHALKVLGVTGRSDYIPSIHSVLSDTNDENVTYGCLYGLVGLDAKDDISIEFYSSELYNNKKSKVLAVEGLFSSERSDARQHLLKYLEDNFDDNPFGIDDRIARKLVEYADTKDATAALIKRHYGEFNDPFSIWRRSDWLEFFGEDETLDLQNTLYEASNPTEGNFNSVGRRRSAIKGLANTDPEAAFDSATRALCKGKHDRDMFPPQLMELDEKNAIPILFRQFLCEEKYLVQRSIGLALRWSENKERPHTILTEWIDHEDSTYRFAAASLAQWICPPEIESQLRKRILKERILKVRHRISDSLIRVEQQQSASEILSKLKNAKGIEVWCFIDCLFKLVDPIMLGTRKDPLWTGDIFDTLPIATQHYLNQRYSDELKKIRDKWKNK